ncbi:MFS transporter [Rhodococcus opacus]|nr:MFS transporter [Rhodococcus opacus]RKM76269.1 MFS transporter [Rhodococcus opacus]
MVFGRMGDRVGRKKTFMTTLLVMGGATTTLGLMPTYDHIGILAPILLVTLRLLQGLAIGGEYGGAVVGTYYQRVLDGHRILTSHFRTIPQGPVKSSVPAC